MNQPNNRKIKDIISCAHKIIMTLLTVLSIFIVAKIINLDASLEHKYLGAMAVSAHGRIKLDRDSESLHITEPDNEREGNIVWIIKNDWLNPIDDVTICFSNSKAYIRDIRTSVSESDIKNIKMCNIHISEDKRRTKLWPISVNRAGSYTFVVRREVSDPACTMDDVADETYDNFNPYRFNPDYYPIVVTENQEKCGELVIITAAKRRAEHLYFGCLGAVFMFIPLAFVFIMKKLSQHKPGDLDGVSETTRTTQLRQDQRLPDQKG